MPVRERVKTITTGILMSEVQMVDKNMSVFERRKPYTRAFRVRSGKAINTMAALIRIEG